MIAVKRELRLGIAFLLGLQVVISFVAIGLLSRLSPAIDRILQENVYSIESAEQMLQALARHREGEPLDPAFGDALGRARANITEPGEREILDRIESESAALVAGDMPAYERTFTALEELIRENRAAMLATRDSARRLSVAGAWAAVLLAMLAFASGVVIAFRIERRIVEPLDEVFAVIKANDAGDAYRRCQLREAPGELREVMEALNELLDERLPERSE